MPEYRDLDTMIFQDGNARQYYNELPGYIREQISSRRDNITTFDALKNYAENLLENL